MVYIGPEIAPTAGQLNKPIPEKKTIIPVIAAIATFGSVALVIFLLAATIVLALIPIYLPTKTRAPNPDVSKSKEITMVFEGEGADLDNYVGGEFGIDGNNIVQAKLLASLPSNKVRDVSVSSVSVGNTSRRRKKRFDLVKRIPRATQRLAFTVRFYIFFVPDCLYACQIHSGPVLQQILYNITQSTTITLTDIPILNNGTFSGDITQLQFVSVISVSDILPGLSPSTSGTTTTLSTSTA